MQLPRASLVLTGRSRFVRPRRRLVERCLLTHLMCRMHHAVRAAIATSRSAESSAATAPSPPRTAPNSSRATRRRTPAPARLCDSSSFRCVRSSPCREARALRFPPTPFLAAGPRVDLPGCVPLRGSRPQVAAPAAALFASLRNDELTRAAIASGCGSRMVGVA